MKMPAKSLNGLVLRTLVGIGVASLLVLPQPSWAEPAQVNPLQDFDTQQNSDPFSGSNTNGNEEDSFGVFDLIHRAQMGNVRTLQDYSTDQNENLDAAAAQFRELQRKRIQGQPRTSPADSVSSPELNNQ